MFNNVTRRFIMIRILLLLYLILQFRFIRMFFINCLTDCLKLLHIFHLELGPKVSRIYFRNMEESIRYKTYDEIMKMELH